MSTGTVQPRATEGARRQQRTSRGREQAKRATCDDRATIPPPVPVLRDGRPAWLFGAGPRPGDPSPDVLDARERAIVRALCEGLSRDEVADRIDRSRSTLDKAVSMIYATTGFRAVYQVVAWAHRVGLYGTRMLQRDAMTASGPPSRVTSR